MTIILYYDILYIDTGNTWIPKNQVLCFTSKKQPRKRTEGKKKMEKLKELVKKENNKQLKKALVDLRKAKKSELIDLWYYNEKLTARQIEKLSNKELTTSEAKEIVKNKIIKEYSKRINKNLTKIFFLKYYKSSKGDLLWKILKKIK